MKIYFFLWIVCFIPSFCCFGMREEWKIWTSHTGSKMEARLIRVDADSVVLRKKNGSEIAVKIHQLSDADQKFIDSLEVAKGNTSVEGIDARPGVVSSKIACVKDKKSHYYLYLPESFHDNKEWPVWFIMSPGGGSKSGALKRYIKGAERLGCILALSVESKNGFKGSDQAMMAMVEDVYDRLPVAGNLGFSSGMSGGSRMAFLMAESERNISGVLSCGSGSGVYVEATDFRASKLPKSTYVYSLIGTNCFNRTEAFTCHTKFPKDYRLHFFPGNHDWAGSSYLELGMIRVMGEGLADYVGNSHQKLKRSYADCVFTYMDEIKDEEPWEAFYLAQFLSEFPVDRKDQLKAKKIADTLSKSEQVKLAIEADQAIWELGSKFYEDVYYKEDRKINKSLLKAAEKLGKRFVEIPHGEIILLGKPCK